MPRKGNTKTRQTIPDIRYNDQAVAKLINKVMISGKKALAERIVYNAFDIVTEKTEKDALEVFKQALENIMPKLEVKGRRVGGATYQVPIEVREERKMSLGLRWLVKYARIRPERGMTNKLAAEILDAYKGAGGAAKKKDDTHRMAEANKAFAHFR